MKKKLHKNEVTGTGRHTAERATKRELSLNAKIELEEYGKDMEAMQVRQDTPLEGEYTILSLRRRRSLKVSA